MIEIFSGKNQFQLQRIVSVATDTPFGEGHCVDKLVSWNFSINMHTKKSASVEKSEVWNDLSLMAL